MWVSSPNTVVFVAIVLLSVFRRGQPFLVASSALLPGRLGRGSTRLPLVSSTRMALKAEDPRPRVIVELLDEEDKVNIMVPLAGKPRNLNRPGSEPLAKAMFRLRAAVAQPAARKASGKGFQKERKQAARLPTAVDTDGQTECQEQEVVCELSCPDTGEIVDETTLNADAWRHGRILRVGSDTFVVDLNPPSVSSLRLPLRPLVGYPQRAVVDLRFATADSCAWRWMRGREALPGEEPSSPRAGGQKLLWEPVVGSVGSGGAPMYVPQEADVGMFLRVDCLPRGENNEEGLVSAVSTAVVATGPVAKAGDSRQSFTVQPVGEEGVRVVSYNLLASVYADSSYARNKLFPYVDGHYLDHGYRMQLIIEELVGYKGDVICLQEVDRTAFTQDLVPALEARGLRGIYLNKAGTVKEGEAVFFRTDKWDMFGQQQVELRKCFAAGALAEGGRHASLREFLSHPCNQELARILASKVTTVAQFVCLVPKGRDGGEDTREAAERRGQDRVRGLVVVNTHLFFHPGAAHIRMLMLDALLREVCAAREAWEAESGATLALVFAGDLNSEPDTGAIEFLASGRVAAHHPEWAAASGFAWGDADDEAGEGEEQSEEGLHEEGTAGGDEGREDAPHLGVTLGHQVALASSDALQTSFTNYVRGYVGTLDYIFYEATRLHVKKFVPLPCEEEVAKTALPSQRFPSDHLSLCCDLHWLPEGRDESLASSDRYPAKLAERQRLPVPASKHLVYKAVSAISRGQVVALPTDTVYGLAAAANNDEGVRRLFAVKGRDTSKALAICVASVAGIVGVP